jgi:pectate lyase
MSSIKVGNWLRKIALTLGVLALLVNSQISAASDNSGAGTPEGFGAGTTGGAGGEVVSVTTADQLKYQLCRTLSASGNCSDNTPRIIQLGAVVDFAGVEGPGSRSGCYDGNMCTAPYVSERLALLDSNDTHCSGKPLIQVSFDNAGNNPLLVGSNKTLIGVGANAGIKGKGLRLDTVSNIIIRNLTISDVNPGIVFVGDAIWVAHADHVWIDHNHFHNIGRQMIASGFGAATNVTISWNDFDGNTNYSHFCDGMHYWGILLGGNPQTITISNNLFHEITGRGPHVDSPSSLVHLVNNYYHNEHPTRSGGFFHALDAGTATVNVLVEGNYFENIETPITNTGTGNVFGSLSGPTTSTQTQCVSTLRRNCFGNIAQPAPVINHFVQDSSVMRAFESVPKSSIVVPYKASAVPAAVMANAGPGHI